MDPALKMARDALQHLIDMDVAYRRGPAVEDAVAIARATIAAIDAQAEPTVTGGSPEHLLQDHDRGLSQWLASKPDARLRVREACADIAAKAPQAAPVGAPSASVADLIAGALYDLMGYLTSRDETLRLGSTEWAAPAADALVAFAEKRGLSLNNPAIETWHTQAPAAHATPPAPQAAPVALTDLQCEQLIETSDGRWHDGEFRIDGPDLMRLLRAAGAAAQGGE